jgi:protein-tyrosine-phosphatase
MAETLMEELIDGQEDDDRLQKGELKVSSAGLFAVEGDEANEDALEALEKLYKIKGEKHKARKLTEEMTEESDLIFTMEESQKHAILDCYPETEGKVFSLKEYAIGSRGDDVDGDEEDILLDKNIDVEDPYGGDEENYRECAEEIRELVEIVLKKILAQKPEDK